MDALCPLRKVGGLASHPRSAVFRGQSRAVEEIRTSDPATYVVVAHGLSHQLEESTYFRIVYGLC